MEHPVAKPMEPDCLRKTWDKFKSLMLERKSTGFTSAVQSLFISELCRRSSGLENELGILANHLKTFDSFLARFEDQCMLRIFLKFEKFKLAFLQSDYNGNEPGCDKNYEGCDDEKMQFTFGHTNPESTEDDFNLVKDNVSEHKLACEKSEANEDIRNSSLFEATENGNKKDYILFSSTIKADGSYSQSASEHTSPFMSSVKRPQNNSKKETLTENCIKVININEKSDPCESKNLKEKILQKFSCRKRAQRKTCLMKSGSQANFCLENSKSGINCPGKSTHTQDDRLMKNAIRCLQCEFLNENARLFNEPMKSHRKVVAGDCCCKCSAVFKQETSLAINSELDVLCQQQREPKEESPTSLDVKCSVSEELPKQNSSHSKRSLSCEKSAQLASLPPDIKIRLKKELRCEICQKATCLKRHKLKHNEENPYLHKTCSTVLSERSHHSSHPPHPKNKPFQCDICELAFSESAKLKDHKRVHTSEKQFVCEICGVSFLSLSGLKNHTRIHSGEKSYKCNICSFASVHSSNLKVHLLIHSGEKKYSCDKCGSRFIDNAKLKRHKMVHTGEKPFRCEACGAVFADKSHLTVHLRTHSGEKPFKCNFCSAAFVESSKLKIHLRTHTGEKPYVCEICGISFAVAYGLKSHMRRHTGEKLYKCNICAYASSQSSNLKTHMSVHSGVNPHVCEMCGAAFRESSKLSRHRITHLD